MPRGNAAISDARMERAGDRGQRVIRWIDDAFDRRDWSVARQLIAQQLKREPQHHWLLS
jgi:hypothetical protein